jgi:hypothetical protein
MISIEIKKNQMKMNWMVFQKQSNFQTKQPNISAAAAEQARKWVLNFKTQENVDKQTVTSSRGV